MSGIARAASLIVLALLVLPLRASAAGTLLPATSASSPPRIVDHHVEVLIENGYARTEVTQTFDNPNLVAIEGIYSLPLPAAAALSEMTISAGDRTLFGEVVERDRAQKIYDEQLASGGQSGLATKQGYQRFEFRISSIPPATRTTVTFSYYQALELDAGIGRYLYPLEEGGTDPAADAFWKRNSSVDGSFSANIELRNAWPIEDVRVPNFEQVAQVQTKSEHEVSIAINAKSNLDRDLVVYYRLPEDLPGRVELVPYRDNAEDAGTFMLVLTPGVALAPLPKGADYVFVLDVSGSMQTKLDKLKAAVITSLRALEPGDRVRIVKFSDAAAELSPGFVEVSGSASVAGELETRPGERGSTDLATLIKAVQALNVEGGTNLFAGMQLALKNLDSERATSVMLVTDGVANAGVVDGPSFTALLAKSDVRVFGFLMGNSANWALMELIAETSGGFYAPISNADDIAGQLGLARDKMTHEAMHDFKLTLRDGNVFDVTKVPSKVHHGEQVVVFGRYHKPGPVTFDIDTRITGKPQHYTGHFDLPENEASVPELERLWAYARMHNLEYEGRMQLTPANDVATAIASLGVQYQLVSDETSMILLDEATFARYGIDPANRDRTQREADARMLRGAGAPVNHSAEVDAAFTGAAGQTALGAPSGSPSASSAGAYGSGSSSSAGGTSGYGGGAAGDLDIAALALFALAIAWRRKLRQVDPL